MDNECSHLNEFRENQGMCSSVYCSLFMVVINPSSYYLPYCIDYLKSVEFSGRVFKAYAQGSQVRILNGTWIFVSVFFNFITEENSKITCSSRHVCPTVLARVSIVNLHYILSVRCYFRLL